MSKTMYQIQSRLRPQQQEMREKLHALGYSDAEIVREGVRLMYREKSSEWTEKSQPEENTAKISEGEKTCQN